MNCNKLYTTAGSPVGDNQNSLTAGERGPILLEDRWLLEKMSHFNRELTPERRMHAKGSGAYGIFTVTGDITKYTKADLFSKIGQETPVFVRFSTAAGERGAADAVRDVRGFAVKFYTRAGNWDLVGNNTPVFFIRDGMKFPDLNHVLKRDVTTNMHNPQSKWDFWTLSPESFHQVTIVMSDRGIPASYRNMDGFGSHTFAMYNSKNERVWVKFHLKTCQGIKNYTDAEAAYVRGKDPDSGQNDLYNAIEKGYYPKWKMYIQVMTEEQAKHHRDNPFDLTKVWSHKEYPLIEVGTLCLNRNVENYYAEVEQAAFSPASFVDGIGPSPDKMLQSRLFAYRDAQMYRLGVNHQNIPVNQAKYEECYYHRDGQMRTDGNFGKIKAYAPNSLGIWQSQPQYTETPYEVSGEAARYAEGEEGDFYQAGDLYRLMTEGERKALIENTARDIMPVTENIKYRHAAHCYLADKEYGMRMARILKLDMDKVMALSKMSFADRIKATK